MTRLDVWEAAYGDRNSEFDEALDDLLAAERLLERQATVQRIRAGMPSEWQPAPIIAASEDEVYGYNEALRRVHAVLDEEAAR